MCEYEECGKSFLRKGHLQRHLSTAHFKERPFICQSLGCCAAFSLKHHLTRHEKLHDNPRPFVCTWTDCGKSFAKHEQLRIHVCLEHTGEPLFKCNLCTNTDFKSKAEFKRHEKTVHSSRMYVCGIEGCGMTFTKWTLSVSHRKQEHSQQKVNRNELICEECGKGPFKSESSLRQHNRVHFNLVEPLIKHFCPKCEKEFCSRSNLKSHLIAVHSSELPFVCHECGKSYGYKKLLKRHIEKKHIHSQTTEELSVSADDLLIKKERNVICPNQNCHRRFFRQYDLDRHIQSAHFNK